MITSSLFILQSRKRDGVFGRIHIRSEVSHIMDYWFIYCSSCPYFAHIVDKGSATFWTSGLHSVLTKFQRAATIPADQKRKLFATNSSLFLAELMAKTKKKIFARRWECCMYVIEKRQKIASRMTIKGRGPGKMPWRAASGQLAVSCRPLLWTIFWTNPFWLVITFLWSVVHLKSFFNPTGNLKIFSNFY